MRSLDTLLDRLQLRLGRYAVRNLMNIMVAGMALVALLDLFVPAANVSYWLSFRRSLILQGQVWRLITFVFVPSYSSLLQLILSLYLYWLCGSALEQRWGAFKFNIYYLCGVLGAILSGFITGYSSNSYLNLSLFLAFAALFPDFEMLLFFILPVKMKWLALVDGILLAVSFVSESWSGRAAILMALINVAIFFAGDAISAVKAAKRRRDWKKNWQ